MSELKFPDLSIKGIDPLQTFGIASEGNAERNEIYDKIINTTMKDDGKSYDTDKLINRLSIKYPGLFNFTVDKTNDSKLTQMLKHSNYSKAACQRVINKKRLGDGATWSIGDDFVYLPYDYSSATDIDVDNETQAMLGVVKHNIKDYEHNVNIEDDGFTISDCNKFFAAYCELINSELKSKYPASAYNSSILTKYEPKCSCFGDLMQDKSTSMYNSYLSGVDEATKPTLKNMLANRSCYLNGCDATKYNPNKKDSINDETCTAANIQICTNNIVFQDSELGADSGGSIKMENGNNCTQNNSTTAKTAESGSGEVDLVSEGEKKKVDEKITDTPTQGTTSNKDDGLLKTSTDKKTNDKTTDTKTTDTKKDDTNNLLLYGGVAASSFCCCCIAVIIMLFILKSKH